MFMCNKANGFQIVNFKIAKKNNENILLHFRVTN
jgi:hypothetical protein